MVEIGKGFVLDHSELVVDSVLPEKGRSCYLKQFGVHFGQ